MNLITVSLTVRSEMEPVNQKHELPKERQKWTSKEIAERTGWTPIKFCVKEELPQIRWSKLNTSR
jgi:hypothetical protein